MKTISFDLDDTLFDANEEYIRHSNKHHGTNLRMEGIIDSDRADPHISQREETKRWAELFKDKNTVSIPPRKDIKKAVLALSKRYRLIIVSARDIDFQVAGRKWVSRHFPGIFSKIVFIKSKGKTLSKPSVCMKEEAALHVDDSVKHVKKCISAGVPVLLIKRPWNSRAALDVPSVNDVSFRKIDSLIPKSD